jgi:hypothetical protein
MALVAIDFARCRSTRFHIRNVESGVKITQYPAALEPWLDDRSRRLDPPRWAPGCAPSANAAGRLAITGANSGEVIRRVYDGRGAAGASGRERRARHGRLARERRAGRPRGSGQRLDRAVRATGRICDYRVRRRRPLRSDDCGGALVGFASAMYKLLERVVPHDDVYLNGPGSLTRAAHARDCDAKCRPHAGSVPVIGATTHTANVRSQDH